MVGALVGCETLRGVSLCAWIDERERSCLYLFI